MMRVTVPASKSITQRALILAALAETPTRIINPLDCDDSKALVKGLGQLGVRIERQPGELRVVPSSQLSSENEQTLFLGNAGTAVRFMTGLSLLIQGTFTIDGNEAMRRRPMPGLLAALGDLGVSVRELGRPGCPPIKLAGGIDGGGGQDFCQVLLRAGGSSQELSALLLSGCRLPGGLQIDIQGTVPSMPYVRLTQAVMAEFGVVAEIGPGSRFRALPGVPKADRFAVETDWSSASYPLAASWLTGKDVDIENLAGNSVQGDKEFPNLLQMLEGPGPRVLSMGETPDLVPGIVACALFADGVTEIVDAAHLRIKESNRIEDLASELRKLGADIDPRPDGMIIRPSTLRAGETLDPHDDHRLAMSFGLVSLRLPAVDISNRQCVTKSYPGFWEMLEGFR